MKAARGSDHIQSGGILQVELHRVAVYHFDLRHRIPDERGTHAFLHRAVDGELYRLGVHGSTVMKLDALANLECPHQTVLTMRILRSQTRLQLIVLHIVIQEGFVDVVHGDDAV